MINIQTIQNVSDCVPLYLPHSLYLKPLAKLHISVALPNNKTGKNISNLDIMEKLSAALKPDKFVILKVSKSTIDFIRFEAELDERARLRSAISRLDGASLKINGFSESFRVRCSEPKDEFPTRYDWDSFFRDANHMDEMKAGERPDTIHLTHLPIRWFCPRHSEHEENVKPSESIFKRIFEKFGSVRCVDIPICDPYRSKMNADINGMKTFSFEQDVLFEAYVQFDEYVGFVRAMDEFRGSKLVRKFLDKTQAINIVCNFDKTKHLSDAQIQRRERVRNRLIQKAKHEEEEVELKKKRQLEELEHERKKQEQEKLAELGKQREREEKRKEKHLKKIQERGQIEISQKIRVEERKLMIAQRKLESIRILEQLFDRLKTKHAEKHGHKKEHDVENIMRERLVAKYKIATEQLLNEQKKKVEEIKSKTPIMGLLKGTSKGIDSSSDEDDDDNDEKVTSKRSTKPMPTNAAAASTLPTPDSMPINPFKAVAAFAAAGNAGAAAGATADNAAVYSSEWMKSLSMFPYVPQVFPGMPPMYRPPSFPVSMNYRGFAPRMRVRGRGRGRGRGNSTYDPHGSTNSYYNNYKNYKYDDEENEELTEGKNSSRGGGVRGGSYYHKSHYSSRSRNRSRSRSRSHSHSRSRYRSSRHYSKRSRSRSRSRRSTSRSRSRSSRSRSKTPPSRTNRKLASTRRSRSPSDSSDRSHTRSRSSSRKRARSHSRSPRSRSRSHSHSHSRSRPRSRSHSHSHSHSRAHTRSKRSLSRRDGGENSSRRRSTSPRRIVLETDKLVRSAEEIKRTIEKDMKERLRDEDRGNKENYRYHRKHSAVVSATSTNGIEINDAASNADTADRRAAADSSMSVGDEIPHTKKDIKRSTSRTASRRNSSDREADAF